MSDAERKARADARRSRIVLHRTTLHEGEKDLDPVSGEEAISLLTTLSRQSWSMSGRPLPSYTRSEIPIAFVRR